MSRAVSPKEWKLRSSDSPSDSKTGRPESRRTAPPRSSREALAIACRCLESSPAISAVGSAPSSPMSPERHHAERGGGIDQILGPLALILHRHALGDIKQHRQAPRPGVGLGFDGGRLQQCRHDQGKHQGPPHRQQNAQPQRQAPGPAVEEEAQQEDRGEDRDEHSGGQGTGEKNTSSIAAMGRAGNWPGIIRRLSLSLQSGGEHF